MQKYKSIDSDEVVFIAEDSGNLYTLSDGVKIMKTFFDKKYMPIQHQEIDPGAFLNTSGTANIQKIMENQQNLQRMKSEINPMLNPDYVDPDAFFNATPVAPDVLNSVLSLDPNRVNTPPSQMVPEVRVYAGDMQNYDDMAGVDRRALDELKRKNAPLAPRLSDAELAKYKQLNEDDGTVDEIQPVAAQINMSNKEFLKEQHEKLLKERGEVDPAMEKYEEKYESADEEEYVPVKKVKQVSKKSTMDTFFDEIERTYDIKINLTIEDKIGDIEFSKMMAKHMKSDIIEYYTKSIFQNVLSDIAGLEKKIYDQLKEIIYGEPPKYVVDKDPSMKASYDVGKSEKWEMIRDVASTPLQSVVNDSVVIVEENSEYVILSDGTKSGNSKPYGTSGISKPHNDYETVSTEGKSGSSAYGIDPATGEKVYDWMQWQRITEEAENDHSEILLDGDDD